MKPNFPGKHADKRTVSQTPCNAGKFNMIKLGLVHMLVLKLKIGT